MKRKYKYVYLVDNCVSQRYHYSSWLKAFKHCERQGYYHRSYESVDGDLTVMRNEHYEVMTIKKVIIH